MNNEANQKQRCTPRAILLIRAHCKEVSEMFSNQMMIATSKTRFAGNEGEVAVQGSVQS